ncbi:hypothetical protein V8J88_05025 [Massilia sp. W12]|uniref:hypothetical protein n=1 Tax=Massilia sp. W12 TaxID=3126507 RepID=UPI0030D148CA
MPFMKPVLILSCCAAFSAGLAHAAASAPPILLGVPNAPEAKMVSDTVKYYDAWGLQKTLEVVNGDAKRQNHCLALFDLQGKLLGVSQPELKAKIGSDAGSLKMGNGMFSAADLLAEGRRYKKPEDWQRFVSYAPPKRDMYVRLHDKLMFVCDPSLGK